MMKLSDLPTMEEHAVLFFQEKHNKEALPFRYLAKLLHYKTRRGVNSTFQSKLHVSLYRLRKCDTFLLKNQECFNVQNDTHTQKEIIKNNTTHHYIKSFLTEIIWRKETDNSYQKILAP